MTQRVLVEGRKAWSTGRAVAETPTIERKPDELPALNVKPNLYHRVYRSNDHRHRLLQSSQGQRRISVGKIPSPWRVF
jgi:hypothetical protein